MRERPVFDSSRRETTSAADAMVRKIQLILFKKSSTFHQKSIFHRGFTVTPCRLKAARHTPNNPRYSRDEPGTDCGHLGARFAPLRFPRPPPTTTAHPHLPCLTWCMWQVVIPPGPSQVKGNMGSQLVDAYITENIPKVQAAQLQSHLASYCIATNIDTPQMPCHLRWWCLAFCDWGRCRLGCIAP